MLRGIIPIVFTPFDAKGEIDEAGLRRIIRFELDSGIHGIGVNGFASEAYKLTDDERRKTAAIAAAEVANQVPLVIGMAAGSTEAAIQQANEFAKHNPAALMVLPPSTMKMRMQDIVAHYVALARAVDTAIMVQQSPHIQQYSATGLSAEALAEIAARSPNVRYFKIEGPGAAGRIGELRPLIDPRHVGLFGGGGGITFLDELRAGASGLIPGVGFNECFIRIWNAWEAGEIAKAERLITEIEPLVSAISGPGHEFSLHARKYLMRRAGYISCAVVRRPTVSVNEGDLKIMAEIVDRLQIRISQKQSI